MNYEAVREVTFQLREGDSVKITRREQVEGLRNMQERDKRRRAIGGNFTFTNMEPMKKLTSEVDALQLGYLFVLQTFTAYDTNVLVIGRNKRPMTRKDIQKALNVGRKVLWEFMKTMELYSVIFQDEDGQYVINEEYIFRGTAGKNTRVVKAYDMRVRKAYEVVRSDKRVKQLGYLVKTLPYLHMKNNILCGNPFEKEDSNIQAFGKAELAALFGITEKALYTLVRTMQLDDEVVFAEITRGKARFYMVNPSICNRGELNPAIRSIFKVIQQSWYVKQSAKGE